MIIQKNDPNYNALGVFFRPSTTEGQYIRYCLKTKKLSLTALAESVKVSTPTVFNVIYGRRRSRRVEAEIARILGHTEWNDVVMEAQLATQGHGKPTKAQIQKAKAQAIKERQQLIIRKRKATRKALGLSSQKEAA